MSQSPDEWRDATKSAVDDAAGQGSGGGEGVVPRIAWLTLVLVSLGAMMESIDATVVAVANPVIATDLGTDLSQLQWVSNGYTLAIAVFLITAGKLGDRFGHKQTFLIGMAGFGVTSALAGMADSIEMLIIFRVLQGIFGAVLAPNSLAVIRNVFPPAQMKTAIGIWAAFGAMAMAAGPLVGGLVVDGLSWRWAFFINVPVAIVVIAVGWALIPRGRETRQLVPIDALGVVLLTTSLFALVWGVTEVPEYGWTDVYPLACFAAAIITGALFVLRQKASPERAVLPLGLFKSKPLSAATIVIACTAFAAFGGSFYFALYLQQVQGRSPLSAGLLLIPQTALFGLGAGVGGAMNKKLGPKLPMVAGALILAAGAIGISMLEATSTYNAFWPWLSLVGIGTGLIVPVAIEVIIGNAPREFAGVASGMQQTALMLGAVLGTAVLGSIISAHVSNELPGKLAAAGVPGDIASIVMAQSTVAAQGITPHLPGAPQDVAAHTATAVHEAFTSGMSTAMIVAAALMVIAAAAAFLVRAPEHAEGEQAWA